MCSDGDMMEGVASEAASLAGHLKLSNLCWIYDNNTITIEGHTDLAFSEDVGNAFRGYRLERAAGRRRQRPASARPRARALPRHQGPTDADHRRQHHRLRRADTSRTPQPRTASRWAPRKSGLTKRFYGWPEDATVSRAGRGLRALSATASAQRGAALRTRWQDACSTAYREAASATWPTQLRPQCRRASCPQGWDADLPEFPPDAKGMATRDASGKVLNAIAANVPWLIGGSADLAPSTKTRLDVRGRRRPRGRAATAAATCISAFASTPWARSSTACRCRKLRAVRRDVPGVQRLHAAVDPAGGA